jgi:S-(hydroxymethyl)glutathione dehydrogenase / alcohol dehydrogenase
MRAAILYEHNSPLVIEEVEIDPPKSGEVLVRMAASGVCHSDLHMLQGIHPSPLPAILGHEGAGVVEEVDPSVANVKPGDHVILSWLPYCGHCRMCARGRPNICENVAWSEVGTMADGTVRFQKGEERIHHYIATSSFAELSVVPAQSAIPVDPSLPLTELSLMGCAVATGVGAVFNTARVRPGDTVAVVGCGGVGLNCVQGAVIANAGVIVAVDTEPGKLELARALGATHTVNPTDSPVVEAVRDLVGGDGVDHSFEAIGNPATIELAIGLVGRGGQAILIGMAPPEARVTFDALNVTFQEIDIKGCWYGSVRPPVDFPLLVDLYREGKLRLDPMIRTCALDEVNDAFRALEAGETARSVIVYGSDNGAARGFPSSGGS